MSESAARQAAHRYLELVNAHDYDQIGSLFALDAVVLGPSGEAVAGREEITALWAEQFSKSGPEEVSAASMVAEGDSCVVELSPRFSGEREARAGMVIDHFTVNAAGEIIRLAIYLRPPS